MATYPYVEINFLIGKGYGEVLPIITSGRSPLSMIDSGNNADKRSFSCAGLEGILEFSRFNPMMEEGIHAEMRQILGFGPETILYYGGLIPSRSIMVDAKSAFETIMK